MLSSFINTLHSAGSNSWQFIQYCKEMTFKGMMFIHCTFSIGGGDHSTKNHIRRGAYSATKQLKVR